MRPPASSWEREPAAFRASTSSKAWVSSLRARCSRQRPSPIDSTNSHRVKVRSSSRKPGSRRADSSPEPKMRHEATMAETRTRVKDLFDLTEKVAVVTGASRGLGLQIAKALGEMGARIAITARKADEFDQARSELQHLGIEVWTGVNDLSHLDEIPALVETLLARFGAIDVLVNNAGTTWGAPAEDHPVEAWQKVMRLNVDAPFLLTREIGRRT